MDEYAGLHIAFYINVQVSPASCNAAAHVLRVVLEVHGEDRFPAPVFTDPAVNRFSLLRAWKEFRRRAVSNRHVVEEPDKQSSRVHDHVKEFFAADILIIFAGIAGRDSKRKLVGFQQFHGAHDFLISAVASSSVVSFFKPFQADGRNEILDTEHFLTEFFINQSAVCKA